MKKLHKRPIFYIASLLFVILPLLTYSSITGKTPVCPNEEEYYSDNAAPSGKYSWSITSGSGVIISSSSGTDLKTIKIRWNDTRQITKIQLSVEYKDGSGNTQYYTNNFNIAIKSVNGYTPPPLQAGLSGTGDFHILEQVNGNYVYDIPWCNNGQKHIFIISPLATFPDGSPVDAYLWTVPAGWQVHNASLDPDGEYVNSLDYRFS